MFVEAVRTRIKLPNSEEAAMEDANKPVVVKQVKHETRQSLHA